MLCDTYLTIFDILVNMTAYKIKKVNRDQYEKKKNIHKYLTRRKKTYPCTYPKCNLIFGNSSQLKKHMSIHIAKKPFVCDFKNCHEDFVNAVDLQNHKEYHKKIIKYQCDLCESNFTKTYNLTKHYKRQHNNVYSRGVIIRPKISEVFIGEPKETVKKYFCSYPGCKSEFLRPSRLERHLCKHTGERPFVCDYENCDKAYTNLCHLKRHKMSHNRVKKIFSCTLCDMTFTGATNLKRHCKRWHDNSLRTFLVHYYPKICEICQAEFSTVKLLKSHVCKEHDRQLYKCKYCPKSFSQFWKLERHLKSSVHRKNKRCKMCSLSFCTYQELQYHDRHEHREIYQEVTCNDCGKKFPTKTKLVLHLRDHSSTDFLSCPYEECSRIYYFKRNLDQHIRIFHMKERFECPFCHVKFTTDQVLKNHVERIHQFPKPPKPPKTENERKTRHDAGKPKKSAVSQLIGLLLPHETEKKIINRHVIDFESL